MTPADLVDDCPKTPEDAISWLDGFRLGTEAAWVACDAAAIIGIIESLQRQLAEAQVQLHNQAQAVIGVAKRAETAERRVAELESRLKALCEATYSHVDGRDLLYELRPNSSHMINIHVRRDGQWHVYEGDWLKTLMWARDGNNRGEFNALIPRPEAK